MTGVAGGINLPWSMLNYLVNFNCQPMNAFSMLGYSFLYSGSTFPFQCPQPSQCSFAKIWGMLRDLDRVQTKRPTWLAVELANKGIYKNLLQVVQSGDVNQWVQSPINSITATMTMNYINTLAFSDGNGKWSLLAFNFHLTNSLDIQITAPTVPSSSATLYVLTSANPTDGNEDSQLVNYTTTSISNFVQTGYQVTLPPFSLTVLTWIDLPPSTASTSGASSSTASASSGSSASAASSSSTGASAASSTASSGSSASTDSTSGVSTSASGSSSGASGVSSTGSSPTSGSATGVATTASGSTSQPTSGHVNAASKANYLLFITLVFAVIVALL